jgi:hypothetical protein
MATTTTTNTTFDRPVNKSMYWIIAAAIILLIALGYAITPNRNVGDTNAVGTGVTAPMNSAPTTDPAMSGGAAMDTTTTDPALNNGAVMENNDPMVTDPAVSSPTDATAPAGTEGARGDQNTTTDSPTSNGTN